MKRRPMFKFRFYWLLTGILAICFVGCRERNHQKFEQFFGFGPTRDVQHIHYHDDVLLDASYWMAFECADSTVQKIIDHLELTPDSRPTNGLVGGLNMHPTPWWDTAFINHARPFSWRKDDLHWYLWYDAGTGKAYFLMYDT